MHGAKNIHVQKQDAIALFGNVMKTAAALGITHPSVSQWPDPLPLHIADRVRGAAVRLGKRLPKRLRGRPEQGATATES